MNTHPQVAERMSKIAASPVCILVVEDEDITRRCIIAILERLGYRTETAGTGLEALAKFDRVKHHLVLTDHRMPGMSGAELADQLKQLSPTTPIVMCSGHVPPGPLPVDAILCKPFSISEIKTILESMLSTDAEKMAVL